MASVELTKHLCEFLPALRDKTRSGEAQTVTDVIREVERIGPAHRLIWQRLYNVCCA